MDYGAIIQLLTSMYGQQAADQQRGEAKAALERALGRFSKVPDPEFAPELGASEAGGVSADPELVAAQKAALAKMGLIESSGGLTLEDEAAQAKAMGQASRVAGANRAAITNQMAARGTGGSGAELAMQMSNSQAAGERANQAGMDSAANAQKRYFQSILARGQMAGNMRGQDFDERTKSATARDLRSQYNHGYGRNNAQQTFENRMRRTGAQAGMDSALSGMSNDSAGRTARHYAAMGVAGDKFVDGIMDYDDEQKKGGY